MPNYSFKIEAVHIFFFSQCSGIQKLEYLKHSVKDKAATVLQSIQISDNNNEIARKMLLKSFENEFKIINLVIS